MLARWIINSAGFWTSILVVPGIQVQSSEQWHLVAVALIAGLANTIMGPVFKFFTFPIVFLTFGLWILVGNVILFWLAGQVGQLFGFGFVVSGFWPTLLGALIVSAVNLVFGSLRKSR